MQNRSKLFASIAACLAIPALAKANLLTQLPSLTTGISPTASFAFGLSADGNTVVGLATTTTAKSPYTATSWTFNSATQSFTPTNLGSLFTGTGGTTSNKSQAYATGVSANGSLIVGSSTITNSSFGAFGYVSGSQVNLSAPGSSAINVNISEDGSTIVANSTNNVTNPVGFYLTIPGSWTQMPAPASVTGLQPGFVTDPADDVSASGVSNNGTVITGQLRTYTDATEDVAERQAYRYTAAGGYQAVGTPFIANSNVVVNTPQVNDQFATPVSGDGNFMANLGTNPVTGKLDVFEYDALHDKTTWFNAVESAGTYGFSPEAITDDGSFVVGRDYRSTGNLQDGWVWSQSTGQYYTIANFLEQVGGFSPAQVTSLNPGDVYGVALNGDTLTLTGFDAGATSTSATSFYAQITVPEPTSLTLFSAASMLLLGRRRRSGM